MHRSPQRTIILCSLVAFSVFALGCGGETDTRKTAAVKGKVTSKGQPVKGDGTSVSVAYRPKSGEKGDALMIQADGTFSGKMVVGENVIWINSYIPIDTLGIKQSFTSESTSPLKANIEAGKENTLTLEVGE
jgi:hypothetical protein